MAQRTWHLFTVITLFTVLSLVGDVFSTSPAPWYENLPAVTMDYKVHIDAGKEDCYFQYVQPGATFYASYQVLKGGDGMCGFAVKHPNGQIVHPYEWRQSAEYADQSSTGGYYAVCIDNQFSRFAGKLVNLYLSVIRYDMWEKYAKEVEELDMNIKNFTEKAPITSTINSPSGTSVQDLSPPSQIRISSYSSPKPSSIQFVERNINDILQYQYHSRARESRDYNLLQDNNIYVLRWSFIQILAIAATASLQVYFVRKLFEVKDNSSKTRI